jgi:hypothetical protein
VARKGIQYMVLYCLTQVRFRRYSSLNLCPLSPARDGIDLRKCVLDGRTNLLSN